MHENSQDPKNNEYSLKATSSLKNCNIGVNYLTGRANTNQQQILNTIHGDKRLSTIERPHTAIVKPLQGSLTNSKVINFEFNKERVISEFTNYTNNLE